MLKDPIANLWYRRHFAIFKKAWQIYLDSADELAEAGLAVDDYVGARDRHIKLFKEIEELYPEYIKPMDFDPLGFFFYTFQEKLGSKNNV